MRNSEGAQMFILLIFLGFRTVELTFIEEANRKFGS